MTGEPISLTTVLGSFGQLWSPRIVATVNDYDVRVAKFHGEYIWHTHDETDEFFLVLDGLLHIGVRDGTEEYVVKLSAGEAFVVLRGVEHRPAAPALTSVLMFEPTGTVTVGDRHAEVPTFVEVTTGHIAHTKRLEVNEK